MSSDLNAYLADRYLVADPKPSKKRKRKQGHEPTELLITDDDATGWTRTQDNDLGGEEAQATVAGASYEFRKSKKSNWKPLQNQSKAIESGTDDSAAVANQVLAAAEAERVAARDAEDEMPAMDDNIIRMSNGTYAGLQSAAAVSKQLQQQIDLERADFERSRRGKKEEETVYRDATGRRIDISMRRAEARRVAAEAEDKERLAKEALRGDVQTEELKRRREQIEEAKFIPLARTADDDALNRELKEKQRWNDPMMQFMEPRETGPKRPKGRPVYLGAAPPNRYSIRPGYRWDGVDRSNAFEGERFKAINRRERVKNLNYSWQMDE